MDASSTLLAICSYLLWQFFSLSFLTVVVIAGTVWCRGDGAGLRSSLPCWVLRCPGQSGCGWPVGNRPVLLPLPRLYTLRRMGSGRWGLMGSSLAGWPMARKSLLTTISGFGEHGVRSSREISPRGRGLCSVVVLFPMGHFTSRFSGGRRHLPFRMRIMFCLTREPLGRGSAE